MSVRRPVLTPDHPAPVAAAHRQAGYPHSQARTTASDHHPPVAGVVIWLAAYAGAARLIATPARSGRAAAASLGLATGLLFDGDVSAKLVGYGRQWLAALATRIMSARSSTAATRMRWTGSSPHGGAGPRYRHDGAVSSSATAVRRLAASPSRHPRPGT